VWPNALVNNGGFPLRAAIYWSCSTIHITAVDCIVCWWLSTWIWIYSHSISYWIELLLLLDLPTFSKCASWVICLGAAFAVSWCTNWYLCRWCVQVGGVLDGAPVYRLNADLLAPCWGVCGTVVCWCGNGEEDDNKMKWEVLRNTQLYWSQNVKSNSQLARLT